MNKACQLAAVALLAAGCAAPEIKKAPAVSGDLVEEGRKLIAAASEKDKILWRYRVALVAMKAGRFTDARQLLDECLPTIGAILTADERTIKARSLFGNEAQKIYVGEPYEQAMAYFYRGLIYWMDGEPDNARACFKSAQLIDGDAKDKAFASDFALLDYLDGFATAKLLGDGSDMLRRARASAVSSETNALTALPDYDRQANVLAFFQFGFGPLKHGGGRYGERLQYHVGHSAVHSVRLKIGEQTLHVSALDDLSFQATTRGGRLMDDILADKGALKKPLDAIATVAPVAGAVLAGPKETRGTALPIIGAGVVAGAVSNAAEAMADTRTWNNLPQHLAFTAFRLPPGSHTAAMEFFDRDGKPLPKLMRSLTFEVRVGRDTVLFISDQ